MGGRRQECTLRWKGRKEGGGVTVFALMVPSIPLCTRMWSFPVYSMVISLSERREGRIHYLCSLYPSTD